MAAEALAISHAGASDGTGSSAKQILNALHGPVCPPAAWLRQLELLPEIECLAADLADTATDTIDTAAMHGACPLA